MKEFTTHGGYFAPQDYMKIDVGGSHEENPNGGVQLGVDNEGVPNLVEEGEPVYKDFVFSDNITIDPEMIEKHNLPKSLSGKLYSKAADWFVDEAEDRPLDPTSNNGLNAMLLRLAEAQEEQKQIEEMRELEKELEKLSPEELEQLEQALAQQEQGGEVAPEQIAPEQVVPEEIPAGVPVEQSAPQFAEGGPIVDVDETFTVRDNTRTRVVPTVGFIPQQNLGGIVSYPQYVENNRAENAVELPDGSVVYLNKMEVNLPFGKKKGVKAVKAITGNSDQFIRDIQTGVKQLNEAKTLKGTKESKEVIKSAMSNANKKIKFGINNLLKEGYSKSDIVAGLGEGFPKKDIPSALKKRNAFKKAAIINGGIFGASAIDQMTGGHVTNAIGSAIDSAITAFDDYVGPTPPLMFDDEPQNYHLMNIDTPAKTAGVDWDNIPDFSNGFAKGGRVNRFDDGGPWNLGDYSWLSGDFKPSNGVGFIPYSRTMSANDIASAENSDSFKAWSNYVLGNWDSPDVQSYLKQLDKVAGGNHLYDANGNQTANAKDYFTSQRGIGPNGNHKWGYYHLTPERAADNAPVDKSAADIPYYIDTVDNTPVDEGPIPTPDMVRAAEVAENTPTPLPTWMRYAGIGINAAAMLGNLAQKPNRYTLPISPVALPYGSIRMVPQEYRAIDPNLAVNALTSQGNATRRAIANSGAGPSTMAGIVAADNNLTNAVGNTLLQGWSDANTRRNAVIAANNAAEAQRAEFDFGVSNARANYINRANELRTRYGLLLQQLNNAEDEAQYQAISSQLGAIAKALSDIGRENFAINQANYNRALGWSANPDGTSEYKWNKNGGLLKKYKG